MRLSKDFFRFGTRSGAFGALINNYDAYGNGIYACEVVLRIAMAQFLVSLDTGHESCSIEAKSSRVVKLSATSSPDRIGK